VRCARRQPERLFRLAEPSGLPPSAGRPCSPGAYPLGFHFVERHLWQSAYDARTPGGGPCDRPPADGQVDERERPQSPAKTPFQAHHRQPPWFSGCAEPPSSRGQALLEQDFTAERPDQKWGADISYVWTREGWLYLAVVIDLFARRVVGWSVGDRLHKELAIEALSKALAMRRPPAGLIHHSDRGSQYCSIDYQAELKKHGIRISMSGKGNCYDNAMVETFFKTLKSELIWRTIFQTRAEAKLAIGRYIDGFYNPVRRHSALDFTSPAKFERLAVN
jgi:transposase InsO family protein